MNKSIVAIAVAGLVGAVGFSSVASAEATVYGRVTAGAVHTDGDTDGNDGAWNFGATGIDGAQGRFNGTRFGFKGSQDLGNGMSAGFQIEREVRQGETPATVRQRHNLVWLSGSWGKLTLGHQNNPFLNARNWDQTYFYGGWWGHGEGYRDEGINYSMSNGPFSLNVMAQASSENQDDTAVIDAGAGGTTPMPGSVETSGDDGIDGWILHAGYDFGVVALNVAHHADNKDTDVTGAVAGTGASGDAATTLANNNAAADTASRDNTAIGVNGSVGPMDWYLAYQTSELNASGSGFEDNDVSSVGGFVGFSASDKDTLYGYYVAHSADRATAGLGEDYTETILGYSRDMGPGIRFIAEYQSLDNDTDADGSDPSTLALAVRYVF